MDFIDGDSIKHQFDLFSNDDESNPSSIRNFDQYVNSFDSYEDEDTLKDEYCDACVKLMTMKLHHNVKEIADKLHGEIEKFTENLNQIYMDNKKQIVILKEEVENLIKSALKFDFKLHIYGSYASGLSLPTSDVDFLIESDSNIEGRYLFEELEQIFK